MRRNEAIRQQVLDGTIPSSTLPAMDLEDFRTQAEKDAVHEVEKKEVLGSSHLFSEVLFEEGKKATGVKCQHCGSTKVLISRRQSYNESSTWCGEEQGAPVMQNCLSCGKVESVRDG